MTDPVAYDAVVFDMDGVIVEPTDQAVLVDAVHETFEAFDTGLNRVVAERTVESDGVPVETIRECGADPEAVWHARELRSSLAQADHVRSGGKPVYDDVSALDQLDVPLALVSNNQQATVEYILAHHEITCFEPAIGRTPTLRGAWRRKPNPYNLDAALSELGTERALYVGDSPEDLVAAHRADIDAAFLRRDHVDVPSLPVDPAFDVPDLDTLVDAIVDPPATTVD